MAKRSGNGSSSVPLIAMVCLFTVTLLATFARHSPGFQSKTEQETKEYYAARGAVAELLSRLTHGEDLTSYTSDNPLEMEVAGYRRVKAWCAFGVPSPGVIQLHAEAGQMRATRVVIARKSLDSVTFSNESGKLKSHQKGDANWADLPTALGGGYNSMHSLVEVPFDPDGPDVRLDDYSANSEGKLVAIFRGPNPPGSTSTNHAILSIQLYDAVTESWEKVARPPARFTSGWLINPGRLCLSKTKIFRPGDTYSSPGTRSVLDVYDISSDTWAEVYGPEDGRMLLLDNDADGTYVAGHEDDFYGTIQDPDSSNKSLVKYSDGAWSVFPNTPPEAKLAEIGPAGEVYAYFGDDLVEFDSVTRDWSIVDVPLGAGGTPIGRLTSVDPDGTKIFCDGSKIYRVEDGEEPEELPELTDVLKAEGGSAPSDSTSADGFSTTLQY